MYHIVTPFGTLSAAENLLLHLDDISRIFILLEHLKTALS